MSEPRKGQEDFSSTVVINLSKLQSKEVEKVEVLLVKAQGLNLLRRNETLLHNTDDCYKYWCAVVASLLSKKVKTHKCLDLCTLPVHSNTFKYWNPIAFPCCFVLLQ